MKTIIKIIQILMFSLLMASGDCNEVENVEIGRVICERKTLKIFCLLITYTYLSLIILCSFHKN